jgi:hypothetical protein
MIAMTKNTIKNNCVCSPTFKKLLEDMHDPSGKYDNLQIIFYRNNTKLSLLFGQKYLVVNKDGFGIYQLNNIDYKKGVILMTFTNPTTGNIAEITIDIHDKHPKHFLLLWDDIKEMVHQENESSCGDNDDILLELDNDKL